MKSNKPVTKEQILIKMEALCARSEQCSFDIEIKLRRAGLPYLQCAEIIESLQERRFIDDRRFAIAFVNDKYRFARWGKRKIKIALTQKRITGETASEAIESIDMDEYVGILRELIIAKTRSIIEGNTFEGRTKLFRFAASRGFEPDLISNIIREEDIWNHR